jgi:Carboxypeptidase regulatory-like domain/TonB dependent receptor-like, beta-barrel
MRSGCRPRSALVASALLALAFAGAPVMAQDFRGAIAGTVSDATGGVLPGVTITVTNLGTGVSQNVITDGRGLYQVLYLNPGTYSVTAELSGFKKVVLSGNEVRVGDVVRADIRMEPGGLEQAVTVTAEAPTLNTTTGVTGTTVDARQIAELPLGDGTAYMLTRLAPGIMDSSDLHFARPADNGNLGGIVANGTQGGNEFSIDGAPNLSNARGVGFSPPSDAIAQFKVQTNAFDAQSGHTAGAVVNLALKSGTNALHGAGGYFNRNDKRSTTPLLTERAGGTKPTREYNRYTGTVGGRIVRDKTFFMTSFEHLRDVQPEPAAYTVPTEKMRRGDFSEFPTLVYDPSTVTGTTGARTAFAGNQIPANRINAVAAAYAALYPVPNRPTTESNYYTNQLRPYDYNAWMARLDHNFSSTSRVFATTYVNKRQEDRYNWAQDASNATDNGIINGFAVTQGFDYRTNTGLNGGHTLTLSNSLLLDTRVSFTRFGEYRDPAQTFDPAKLGFSPAAISLMNGYQYLPLFTFGSFSTTNSNSTIASLGSQRSDWGEGFDRPMTTISLAPTLTKVWGGHTVRLGYDLRYQRWDIISTGFPGGRFSFNGAYTRANNSAATNDRAQSWAQFLLGLPTVASGNVATPGTVSSQFEVAAPGQFRQWYHGVFAQDDWRVGPRLTVNLGLRFEASPGLTETQNRNLAGFDTATVNPIQSAAQAAYVRNPIPEIPVSSFRVPGGLLFESGPTYRTLRKPLPRAALSYLLNDRTVIRGGAGLFSYDLFFDNINQQGFSVGTPILTTTDNGLTFTGANLTNPIPGGALVQPVGNASGLASQLGQNLTGNAPAGGGPQASNNLVQQDRKAPYYARWEASIQHDFGSGWVLAATYVGSHGTNLPAFHDANTIPIQYLSTSRFRDTANETFLTTNVANPFAGLLAGSTINGATVQRQQLLRPFPEFGTFGIEENDGSDRYNAASLQLDRHFKSGNSFTIQYTRSALRDRLKYLNPADGTLEDRVSPNDRPNRFSLGSSIVLPFGRNHRWGSEWSAPLDAIAGGWQVSGTYQYQSGFPLTWNATYWDSSCGDPTSLVSSIGKTVNGQILGLDVPAWDTKCFYFHDAAVQTNGVDDPVKQRNDQRIQLANNVRYFPSTLPDVRTHQLHLMDVGLFKNFQVARGITLQLRVEVINALNYTVLWNPDVNPRNATFGFINQDRNNPRDIQLGLRVTF